MTTIKRTVLAGLLATISCLAATDAHGNDNTPVQHACTFEGKENKCNMEFSLSGFLVNGRDLGVNEKPYYRPWGYYIILNAPPKYLGWIEWHVRVWTGDKWLDGGEGEDQIKLLYSPLDHDMTRVSSSSKALHFRVTLEVVRGNPPADGDAVTVTAYPDERNDFIELEPDSPATETAPTLPARVATGVGSAGRQAFLALQNQGSKAVRHPTP